MPQLVGMKIDFKFHIESQIQ